MKKILILPVLLQLIAFQSISQCEDNRYRDFIFGEVDVTPDLVYGNANTFQNFNQDLALDVYQPAGDEAQGRALVIVAHGGSFVAGSRDGVDVVPLCTDLAKMGYVSASITYRLGLEISFDLEPAALAAVLRGYHDMKAAIRWFRKSVAEDGNPYNIDPDQIYLAGSSAGGFIALHVAYMDELDEFPEALNFTQSGMVESLEGNSGNPGYPDNVAGVVNIAGALGDSTWIQPNDIPACLFHGTGDQTVPFDSDWQELAGFQITEVDGSNSIAQKFEQEDVTHCFEIYDQQGHVPHVTNQAYYDTTLSITSNFLSHLICGVDLDCEYREIQDLVIGVEETGLSSFSVYPNPAQDVVRIKGVRRNYSYSISDLSGKIVVSKTNGTGKEIDISNLQKGLYTLRIFVGDHTRTKKIVVR